MSEAVMTEDQTTSSSTPAAGWYPDPQGQGLRWWDGSTWTEHTHEEGAAAATTTATASTAPSAASTASTSPAIATSDAGKPAKGEKKARVNFVNEHAMVILIALLAVLAVVVVLQVI